MTRLQQLRIELERLRQENIRLHAQKEVLEKAWSQDVKAGIPALQEGLNSNFQRMAELEAEEHRITWPRTRNKS
jgi:hypothetical protein